MGLQDTGSREPGCETDRFKRTKHTIQDSLSGRIASHARARALGFERAYPSEYSYGRHLVRAMP
jgi:hypothetical protein